MQITKFISKAILRYPYLNLLFLLTLSALFFIALLYIRFDTSLSAFVIKNDPDMVYYNKIKDIFETDETIVIAFKADGLFSKKDLQLIERLSDKISDIEFVRNVRSLTTTNLISTAPGMFEVKGLVDKMPENQQESAAIKKHATTNYLYVKDLSSADGRYASLLIDIRNDPKQHRTREVVESIKKILSTESKDTGYRFYLGGDAVINDSLGEYMKRDFFAFLLPTYLLLTILLVLTIGRLRDIVISLITITLSLLWTMGTISLLGKSINNVTIGIIPLILCIALEDIYYIHNAYYSRLQIHKNKKLALEEALNHIFSPCFFTSLTTAIGFGFLMVNNIKPILDFGIVGSIAVMLTFVIAMLLIPSIHMLLKIPSNLDIKPRFKINPAVLLAAIEKFIKKRGRLILMAVPVILIVATLGIFRMHIETDHLTFFHKNSETYKATTFIEKNLAGISNLEIIVNTDKNDLVKYPELLAQVDRLTQFLREQKNIDKATSIVDFLKDMNRAMHDNDQSYYVLPDTKAAVAQYLLLYSMSPRRNDIEKDFVDFKYTLARIRCRMSEHNSSAIIDLLDKIKLYIKENMDPGLDVKITSYPVIYSNMLNSLARGQVKCLILVFFALWISTSIYFKSVKIGLIAMIPNIIPITCTLGLMGWAGISLNIATAMTASIAIGLAMDDTTHFFSTFRDKYSKEDDYDKGIYKTLSLLGEPMMYSSYLMIAGYLVMVLSQFRLTVLFGFFCAFTILMALISDLFLTPLVLSIFRPKFK